ncbi:glycosyltransferase family 2 protein [Azospirillum rugosum]|uniref:Glycosyltransferase involved in cell wall biosynthesis n=1 Tax=Azospirillum rugosum TaxID=416170 RepID=A0ABS4SGT1_9PROT|nr:glycosyltransferase family 2 protein [Azospirillum rugosum]MBP2291650.1 glycosyltransferase involved in cell wall biosynthesis [Azospirillum rugosum]MDQ0524538.1 glycosyltransferase involved in cell wall biosynthesis [Azospirillum rugosum]
MADRPLVSIITPSWGREAFLPLCHARVQAQTWPEVEWLVFDDSPRPNAYLQPLAGPRLKYFYSPSRYAIGEKRNILAEHARGAIIVHFDDDDFYAPTYVERMVERLEQGCDAVKLSGWFLYSAVHGAFGYWDTARGGSHHRWGRNARTYVDAPDSPASDDNRMGYGFSYAYRRAVWEAVRFPAVNACEDAPFMTAARERFRVQDFPDAEGLCLHTLHARSTSLCLPQYELPPALLDRLFGPEVQPYTQAAAG